MARRVRAPGGHCAGYMPHPYTNDAACSQHTPWFRVPVLNQVKRFPRQERSGGGSFLNHPATNDVSQGAECARRCVETRTRHTAFDDVCARVRGWI